MESKKHPLFISDVCNIGILSGPTYFSQEETAKFINVTSVLKQWKVISYFKIDKHCSTTKIFKISVMSWLKIVMDEDFRREI